MLDQLFSNLTLAMSGNFSVALAAALGWGALSILLSPCHLSSIPLVIGYITSQGQIRPKRSFNLALVFALGILLTIAGIGVATASMGRIMGDVGVWGNYLVAGVFILVGLYLMDILRWDWNGISPGTKKRSGLRGAFILGLIFGIGLGPCTFAFLAPVLGVVFQTASSSWLKAVLLITTFGAGQVTVIVIAGSLTGWVQHYLNWTESSRTALYVKRGAGLLVVLGGFYFIYTSF